MRVGVAGLMKAKPDVGGDRREPNDGWVSSGSGVEDRQIDSERPWMGEADTVQEQPEASDRRPSSDVGRDVAGGVVNDQWPKGEKKCQPSSGFFCQAAKPRHTRWLFLCGQSDPAFR